MNLHHVCPYCVVIIPNKYEKEFKYVQIIAVITTAITITITTNKFPIILDAYKSMVRCNRSAERIPNSKIEIAN